MRVAAGTAHAGETLVVLRRPHRLLEPVEVVGPVGALHLDRLRHAPGAVDVVHDGDVRPRPLARRLDRVDAVLVQLDVPEAALDHLGADAADRLGRDVTQQAGVSAHLRPARAAEQVAERQAGALAGDVPQRDVDGRMRIDHGSVAAEDVEGLRRLAVQSIDVGRVLADEPRAHIGLERRLGRRDDGVAEALAPAGDAGVGLNLHQQVVHGRKAQAGEVLLRRPHVEGNAHVVGVDRRDLHGCLVCPKSGGDLSRSSLANADPPIDQGFSSFSRRSSACAFGMRGSRTRIVSPPTILPLRMNIQSEICSDPNSTRSPDLPSIS